MSASPASGWFGLAFYGNANTKEVHRVADRTANCQLDEIKDGVRFSPDTLAEARRNGYDNCHWCIGGSTR